MLLQPIVENAIFHGIAPKEVGGKIKLEITIVDELKSVIAIRITDDGVGITADKLVDLLKFSTDKKSGMFGIGLNHVHETIQLYYGHESGVYIQSEPGHGTAICLELVVREEETKNAI